MYFVLVPTPPHLLAPDQHCSDQKRPKRVPAKRQGGASSRAFVGRFGVRATYTSKTWQTGAVPLDVQISFRPRHSTILRRPRPPQSLQCTLLFGGQASLHPPIYLAHVSINVVGIISPADSPRPCIGRGRTQSSAIVPAAKAASPALRRKLLDPVANRLVLRRKAAVHHPNDVPSGEKRRVPDVAQ